MVSVLPYLACWARAPQLMAQLVANHCDDALFARLTCDGAPLPMAIERVARAYLDG